MDIDVASFVVGVAVRVMNEAGGVALVAAVGVVVVVVVVAVAVTLLLSAVVL